MLGHADLVVLASGRAPGASVSPLHSQADELSRAARRAFEMHQCLSHMGLPPTPPPPLLPLQGNELSRAARLAFEMRHPGRLLAVVTRALQHGPAEGEALLEGLAAGMSAGGRGWGGDARAWVWVGPVAAWQRSLAGVGGGHAGLGSHWLLFYHAQMI